MSAHLALHFLGPPQIHLNDMPLTLERRKGIALLAYLALEGGRHTRASLSALLWPDQEGSKAYKNLRQILWELQQSMGEGWIAADRESIGLSQERDIWLDVPEFESRLAQGQREIDISQRVALLSEAARLYRNHFLTGFSLRDAHPFNDWASAWARPGHAIG
jgi:DNA-binding SARP family transcriptional activator